MPNYTENYGLKKPLPNENYNIQDHNDNMDIIDAELKKLDENIKNVKMPVTSVNSKTGDVVLNADDVGAETPAGAQQKANQAEANAKAYADTVANSALALGKSYTDQNLATHEGKTASTSQKGHVQLSSSLTSTSETTAATSNAVKQLNDKITTLNNTVAALYVTNEATGKKYTLHFDDIGLYLKEV